MDKEIFRKGNLYLTLMLAFFMPLLQKLLPLLIVGLVLNFIGSLIIERKPVKFRAKSFTFLMLGFYGLHVLGLIYSDNLNYGLFDLEVKLSFIVLPIVYSLSPSKFSERDFNIILKAFLIGGCVAIAISFVRSCWYYEGDINVFFGDQFAFLMHLGYFSLHLNFCFAILLYFTLKKLQKSPIKPDWLILNFLLIFCVALGIFLTTSRMGIIICGFQFIVFVGLLIFKFNYKKIGFAMILAIGSICFMGIEGGWDVKPIMRFKVAFNNMLNGEIDESTSESVSVRKLIWKSALGIIVKNPVLGTGTGDVKDELIKKYEENGYTGALNKKLNAHNQFIQTAVSLGVMGLMFFLSCLFYFLYIAVKQRFILSFFLFLILLFGSLTESILEVQAGVIFFVFFGCLIAYFAPLRKDILNNGI